MPLNRHSKRPEPTWVEALLSLSWPGPIVLVVFGGYLTPLNMFGTVMLLGGMMISSALIARAMFARGPIVSRLIATAVCAIYPALFLASAF